MTEMQIGSFLAVAETLNFSRAAEQMAISQPTLSKHIKLLEESLGFPLLERTRSAVALTPEGVLMYHTLKGVRDQVKLSIARSRSGNVGGKKKVGIGIMRGLSVDRIPVLKNAIAQYRAAEAGNDVIMIRSDVKNLWSMLKLSLIHIYSLAGYGGRRSSVRYRAGIPAECGLGPAYCLVGAPPPRPGRAQRHGAAGVPWGV